MATLTGIFIDNNSFVGKYAIARSPSADIIIQSIIDEWERKYIMKLLGVELGKLLIAYQQDVSHVPVQRYDDLIAAFDLQNKSTSSIAFQAWDKIYSSLGIKDMLTAMIYYHYIVESQLKSSQSGIVKANVETADVPSPVAAAKYAETRWNAACETITAIQWFCEWKTDDTTGESVYPEFSGEYIAPQYGSAI